MKTNYRNVDKDIVDEAKEFLSRLDYGIIVGASLSDSDKSRFLIITRQLEDMAKKYGGDVVLIPEQDYKRK